MIKIIKYSPKIIRLYCITNDKFRECIILFCKQGLRFIIVYEVFKEMNISLNDRGETF
jgi:hypothetical protein